MLIPVGDSVSGRNVSILVALTFKRGCSFENCVMLGLCFVLIEITSWIVAPTASFTIPVDYLFI